MKTKEMKSVYAVFGREDMHFNGTLSQCKAYCKRTFKEHPKHCSLKIYQWTGIEYEE
jgi:hypothetical protein